jgi:hypothetical protein
MKTSLTSKMAGASVGLVISLLFASNALAGPGPQYWQQQDKIRAENAAKRAATATHLCAGAQTVPVTTMKPAWSNGRGPLTKVQVGTKTVCRMCPVTEIVTQNAWSNGRGPITRTEVTKPGAEHDCSKGCTAVAMN